MVNVWLDFTKLPLVKSPEHIYQVLLKLDKNWLSYEQTELYKTELLVKQNFINLYYNQKYVYIMLGEKDFISKHGETIITKCSNENNYK